jgi:CBS domain containing-hemolysin-like protein
LVAAVGASALGSLCAAADAALHALPEGRLQALAQESTTAGRAFARFAEDRTRIVSRWLVARIVSISLAAVLVFRAAEDFGYPRLGLPIAVGVALLAYGSLTEILGTWARHRAERAGELALRFLWPIEWAVAPVAEPLARLGSAVGSRIAPAPVVARLAEEEVSWALAEGEKSGAIPEEPAEMIRNVLDFKDLTARDVMVPRRRITAIDASTSLEQALAIVSTEGHSRYPVFRETLDNVVGLLYAKDLFQLVGERRLASKKLADLVRAPVLFVAEAQSAASILREMRARRLHMAIVSDEFGGTSGIVTLEDILEEIVGDIRDEYDTEADAPVQLLGDGRIVADAAVSLGDLEAHLGRAIEADEAIGSLGGLLVHHEGRVPSVGSVIQLDGLCFIVREADETRVVKVEISEQPATPALPEPRVAQA